MSGKEYLKKIKYLNDLIQSKFNQIEELRSLVTRMTPVLKDINVQDTPISDNADIIIQIIELENKLKADIRELLALQDDVRNKIDAMASNEYRLLLSLRYLQFKTWEQIAVQMGFTFQWVHKIHSRALVEFDRLYFS